MRQRWRRGAWLCISQRGPNNVVHVVFSCVCEEVCEGVCEEVCEGVCGRVYVCVCECALLCRVFYFRPSCFFFSTLLLFFA